MLVSVVSIGNSRGVRLPKAILDQLEITDKVELEVVDGRIVLKPIPHEPRDGWDLAFSKMSENGDDGLFLHENVGPKEFEWEW